MIEIIPTYVPHAMSEFAAGMQKVRAIAPAVHIDIDDGIFAPHLTWPYKKAGEVDTAELSRFRLDNVGLTTELHLMVEEPEEIGTAFARAGAHRVFGHVEGFADGEEARSALSAWKGAGAREVGLALLLQTPFTVVAPLVSACDVVHLMSIASIGVQGIPYEQSAPARIAEFHRRFPDALISVDGGVSEKNIADLVRAGASRFGVGSAISKAADPKAAYETLKSLAENAIQ